MAQALAFGLSGAVDGSYRFSVWGPLAVISASLLLVACIAVPLSLGRLAAVAAAGLALILMWSLLSFAWAESLDRAWIEVNRAGLYLVTFLTAALMIRDDRVARLVMGVLGVAVSVIAAYVLVRFLIGTGSDLFFAFRLMEPLGYTNGQAAYLAMGFWAVFALSDGDRRPLVGAVGVALCVVLGGMLVLTQSRGGMAAFLIAAVVAVALFPERLRRTWMLAVVAAAVASALPWLLDVHGEQPASGVGGVPHDETVRTAAVATVVAAAAAAAVWGAGVAVWRRWAGGSLRRAATVVLVLIGLGAVTSAAEAIGDPAQRISSAYDDFVTLDTDVDTRQRFTSAGGYRYDYWRIALDAFADAPAKGLGAGNYPTTYIRERRNPDYVTQPHSLGLQLLAELGIVGALGLLLVAGAAAAGVWRKSRSARSQPELQVAVGFTAIFAVWLVQTNVDWMYNIPGVTGMALIAVGVLTSAQGADGLRRAVGRGNMPTVFAMLLVLLVSAGVGTQWVSDRYRDDARELTERDPESAVSSANRALSLNPERIDSYVVKAAAYARLDDYRRARQALRTAVTKERHNFLPWALLGDLAVRAGDLRSARRDYARASALNPLDPELEQLARSPEKVARGSGQ